MAEIVEDLLRADGIIDIAIKKDIKKQLSNIGVQRGMLLLVMMAGME